MRPKQPVASEATVLNEAIKKKKAAIVCAGWHREVTSALAESARQTLLKAGIEPENIFTEEVPGAFELPLGVQFMFEYKKAELVVAIGCLVKGETPHFHYLAESVSLALVQLQARANCPIGFGLLTVDTLAQAKERAGGVEGNKGAEAAQAALYMLSKKEDLKNAMVKKGIGFGSGGQE